MSYLQSPGSITTECITGMNDMAMSREAAKQILDTLHQRVSRRVNQDFRYQVLRCKLNQSFTYKNTELIYNSNSTSVCQIQ